jgi:hypothetical protein
MNMVDSISWLKIASGTAKPRFSADTIQRWFAEADHSNRLQTPDISICEKVALRIEELLSLSAPQQSPVSIETRKYARLLLRHLKRDYAAIEALGASAQSMAGWNGLLNRVRDAVAPVADASGTTLHRLTIAAPWRRSLKPRGGKLAANQKPLHRTARSPFL